LLGGGAGAAGELDCRRAARLHDLLLCRDLYGMAQTPYVAEHCHRRRGRRLAADDRVGVSNRRCLARALPAVPYDLLVDAAAFLGAVALTRRRLRAGAGADAARRRRPG